MKSFEELSNFELLERKRFNEKKAKQCFNSAIVTYGLGLILIVLGALGIGVGFFLDIDWCFWIFSLAAVLGLISLLFAHRSEKYGIDLLYHNKEQEIIELILFERSCNKK